MNKQQIKLIIYLILAIAFIVLVRNFNYLYNSARKGIVNVRSNQKGKEERIVFKNYPNGINEDLVLSHNAFYQIYYIKADNSFLISIIGSPFNEIVPYAEDDLINILGVSKENACKLNVKITTPAFANPDEAGKVYGLSFCKNE